MDRRDENKTMTPAPPADTATAASYAKRYRLSYRNGVIEEDGSPRDSQDSMPMVLASDYDAVVAELTTLRRQLREAGEALEQAERGLATCYQVCEWPADGQSTQDDALRAVRATLRSLRGLV